MPNERSLSTQGGKLKTSLGGGALLVPINIAIAIEFLSRREPS